MAPSVPKIIPDSYVKFKFLRPKLLRKIQEYNYFTLESSFAENNIFYQFIFEMKQQSLKSPFTQDQGNNHEEKKFSPQYFIFLERNRNIFL